MAAARAIFPISHDYVCVKKFQRERNFPRSLYCSRIYSATSTQLRAVKNYPRFSFKCAAANTDPLTDGVGAEQNISRETLLWRAIKLPMYTVALIPVTVGSAAAYLQTGLYFWNRYLVLLVSFVIVIAWLNLSNDVYDFDTGADVNKRESVVNLSGNRALTHAAAWLLLALGMTGLGSVAVEARNMKPLLLLCCSVLCFYAYQGPPFRWSYKGVGEPLLFAAFGPLATTAFYLLQTGTSAISRAIICSSSLVGLTTALILFCSHFHQIDDDRAVGKMSPLVRLGTKKGSDVVKVGVFCLYAAVLICGLNQALPFSSVVFCGLTLPMGLSVVKFVAEYHTDKGKIFMAKYYCVRLHTLFGVALAFGLVFGRMLAMKELPLPIVL